MPFSSLRCFAKAGGQPKTRLRAGRCEALPCEREDLSAWRDSRPAHPQLLLRPCACERPEPPRAEGARHRTARRCGKRPSAHFAFDTSELCLAYWSGAAKRASTCGDAASAYLLPPRYYQIEMATPVKTPMAVAEWVVQLIARHVDPTPAITEYWAPRSVWRVWEYLGREMTLIGEIGPPADPRGLALFLHGEDRKRAEQEWPLPD